jgi:hypothetical protein
MTGANDSTPLAPVCIGRAAVRLAVKLPAAAGRGAWTATSVNGLALASAGAVVEAERSCDHESQRGDFETLGV